MEPEYSPEQTKQFFDGRPGPVYTVDPECTIYNGGGFMPNDNESQVFCHCRIMQETKKDTKSP